MNSPLRFVILLHTSPRSVPLRAAPRDTLLPIDTPLPIDTFRDLLAAQARVLARTKARPTSVRPRQLAVSNPTTSTQWRIIRKTASLAETEPVTVPDRGRQAVDQIERRAFTSASGKRLD